MMIQSIGKKLFLALVLGVFIGAEVAEAQRTGDHPTREEIRQRLADRPPPPPAIGVRALYDFGINDFGVGAHVQVPVGRILRVAPSAEVYFGDETTWQLNADAVVSILLLRAGGGLAVVDGARVAGDDDGVETGLNLFAGIQSPRLRAAFRPFADARWTFLGGTTAFRLVAGVNIPLAGGR
jgi:hypothetical protein